MSVSTWFIVHSETSYFPLSSGYRGRYNSNPCAVPFMSWICMSTFLVVKAALKDNMFMPPFMLKFDCQSQAKCKRKQRPLALFVLSQMWIAYFDYWLSLFSGGKKLLAFGGSACISLFNLGCTPPPSPPSFYSVLNTRLKIIMFYMLTTDSAKSQNHT